MLAITREVAPSIVDCELTHLERQPIDFTKAQKQHKEYCAALSRLGLKVISLPHLSLPDGVFVEDPAVVVDEIALINKLGALARRAETPSLAEELAKHRELMWMDGNGTLDGGDVLRVDKNIFVGLSGRTNKEGFRQLAEVMEPFGYKAVEAKVEGCLHFKTACSFIGRHTVLINPQWVNKATFADYETLAVDPSEPGAANALLIGDTVLCSQAFPRTLDLMMKKGFSVEALDNSELLKAESGMTCSSLIFKSRLA